MKQIQYAFFLVLAANGLFFINGLTAKAHAEEVAGYVQDLYHGWEEIRYKTPTNEQEKGYQELKVKADKTVEEHPEDASAWIWRGIIASTYAGAKGGLSALSLVKEAKASLEQAISIDPNAFGGAAYTSLGALYYQVPGWPLSFGDDDKAAELLLKGLNMNPAGIDANFFYGDYLAEQGQFDKARQYLNRALEADPRPTRPVADAGRREEIYAVLKRMN